MKPVLLKSTFIPWHGILGASKHRIWTSLPINGSSRLPNESRRRRLVAAASRAILTDNHQTTRCGFEYILVKALRKVVLQPVLVGTTRTSIQSCRYLLASLIVFFNIFTGLLGFTWLRFLAPTQWHLKKRSYNMLQSHFWWRSLYTVMCHLVAPGAPPERKTRNKLW